MRDKLADLFPKARRFKRGHLSAIHPEQGRLLRTDLFVRGSPGFGSPVRHLAWRPLCPLSPEPRWSDRQRRRSEARFFARGRALLIPSNAVRNTHARTLVRAYAPVNGLISQSVTPAETPRAWSSSEATMSTGSECSGSLSSWRIARHVSMPSIRGGSCSSIASDGRSSAMNFRALSGSEHNLRQCLRPEWPRKELPQFLGPWDVKVDNFDNLTSSSEPSTCPFFSGFVKLLFQPFGYTD